MKFSAAGGWFSGDWYNRVKQGGENGFQGVEQLGWLGLDFERAKATLDEYGVTSTAIVIQSEVENNMKLTAWGHGMTWADSRQAFIDSFRESVKAAHAMNVPNIIATTGNERFDVSREEQFDICVGTLKEISKIAEDEGIMIVLEPLNVLVNHMGYFLVTTEEAAILIDAVNKELSDEIKKLYVGVAYRHCLIWNGADDQYDFTRPHDIIGKRIGDYLPNDASGKVYLDFMKATCDILEHHPLNE